jgi:hypothetical protein
MPRRKHEQNIDDELIKKVAHLLKNEKLNKKQNEAYSLHARKLQKYKRLNVINNGVLI